MHGKRYCWRCSRRANFYAQDRQKTRKNQREITKDIVQFGEVELGYETLLFLEAEFNT